jgi:hypothetical protein
MQFLTADDDVPERPIKKKAHLTVAREPPGQTAPTALALECPGAGQGLRRALRSPPGTGIDARCSIFPTRKVHAKSCQSRRWARKGPLANVGYELEADTRALD